MNKISTLLITLLLLTGCVTSGSTSDSATDKKVTYEYFNKETKHIHESLGDFYDEVIVADQLITSIPSREEWKSKESDFDVHENNALKPKKIEVFIMHKKLNAITKATFVYNKIFNEKQFLSVNRVDSYTNRLLEDSKIDFPEIYLASFASEGMIVEVLTFPSEQHDLRQSNEKKTEEQVDDMQLELINKNREVIEKIQESILNN